MPFCRKCGEEVPSDAEFCPECGARMIGIPVKKSTEERPAAREKRKGFRIAGGVLTIIASCILIFVVLTAWGMAIMIISSPSVYTGGWPLIAAILYTLFFGFGLAGGICALAKRALAIAIFGAVLVLVAGIIALFPLFYYYTGTSTMMSVSTGLVGFPVLLLALLGLIFTAVAGHDFKK